MRPTEAVVDRGAIERNVARLAAAAPRSRLCAVVKAGGYGHGAPVAARSAIAGGATWLAVATPEEAVELDGAGIDSRVGVLVLSEIDRGCAVETLAGLAPRVRLAVGSLEGVAALAAAGAGRTLRLHLEIDTGMHRTGVAPAEVVVVADAVAAGEDLVLEGVWTHCAVADDPDDPFTEEQLRRFDVALEDLRAAGHRPALVHAANSAALIACPAAHGQLVRPGIAIYGVEPSPALEGRLALEPALSLVSRVSAVRSVAPGEGVSYGRRWRATEPTAVATVPIGYADGIARASAAQGVEALVRGRRRPMLGAVTMDQLMLAVDHEVSVGDEVVLIGTQGDDRISATEVAARLGTIAYEVLTSIGPRVPRRVVG
ncbi:MAG: alanine racemase [Acidimicrobiales bacterium]